MSATPFAQMTGDEAKTVAKEILGTSKSDDEVTRRLQEAGFEDIDVTFYGVGPSFTAIAKLRGPRKEYFTVTNRS